MNIETASANVITMDEAVKDAAVPNKQTEESVKAKLLPEVSSGEASANVGTMD